MITRLQRVTRYLGHCIEAVCAALRAESLLVGNKIPDLTIMLELEKLFNHKPIDFNFKKLDYRSRHDHGTTIAYQS